MESGSNGTQSKFEKGERERLHDTHAQMTLCVSCLFMCHCAHNKCFDCFSHVDCFGYFDGVDCCDC